MRFFKAELVELPEFFRKSYDLYAVILLPNGTDFVTLENINQFSPLNQPQKWLASRKLPVKLLDLTLPKNLPTGGYCIYGILSPKDEPVLEVKEQWIMDDKCFEVLPSL